MARLIDADALIDNLERREAIEMNYHTDKVIHLVIDERYGSIVEELRNAPTVEPKKGKWIDNGEYIVAAYEILDYYTCSLCNASVLFDNCDSYNSYCPNCGARMEEE